MLINFVLLLTIAVKKIEDLNINIYPNPTSSILNIELPSEEITATGTLFDSLGRVIKKELLMTKYNQIRVEDVSNGVYYLLISFEDNSQGSAKIIITK